MRKTGLLKIGPISTHFLAESCLTYGFKFAILLLKRFD